jgi:hypothetical protein
VASSDDDFSDFESLDLPKDDRELPEDDLDMPEGDLDFPEDDLSMPEPEGELPTPAEEAAPPLDEATFDESAAPQIDPATASQVRTGRSKKAKKEKKAKEKKVKKPKAPSDRWQWLLRADPFTVMLALSLLAILIAVFCLVLELARYGFDIKAEEVRLDAARPSAVELASSDVSAAAGRIDAWCEAHLTG